MAGVCMAPELLRDVPLASTVVKERPKLLGRRLGMWGMIKDGDVGADSGCIDSGVRSELTMRGKDDTLPVRPTPDVFVLTDKFLRLRGFFRDDGDEEKLPGDG